MKVCHVGYYADCGGGGIAALRLHRALQNERTCESVMAAIEPGGVSDCLKLGSSWFRKSLRYKQSLLWRAFQYQRSGNVNAHTFNVFPGHLTESILAVGADVVHLHGVVGEMLSIPEIAALARRTTVVWTLHDCWPFTGSEQYPMVDSRRFIEGYSRRNREDPGIDFDRMLWRLKRHFWQGVPVSFIAPSRWMHQQLQASKLWHDSRSEVIGNAIDGSLFAPGNRRESRRRLGLPESAFLLGFGASDLNHPNKGGAELLRILNALPPAMELVTLGKGIVAANRRIHTLGVIRDPLRMVDFYRSCNLFLSASKYDNLPNMILESMACGTPVAAFAIGGIPDLVCPENGLLSPPDQPEALAEQIVEYAKSLPEAPGWNARNHILRHYDAPVIARRHLAFYESLRRENSQPQ